MPFLFGKSVYGVDGHNGHKRVTCRPFDIIGIRFENCVRVCSVCIGHHDSKGVNAKLLDDIVC